MAIHTTLLPGVKKGIQLLVAHLCPALESRTSVRPLTLTRRRRRIANVEGHLARMVSDTGSCECDGKAEIAKAASAIHAQT